MKPPRHRSPLVLSAGLALVLLTGCGSGDAGSRSDKSPSAQRSSAADGPRAPRASRAPAAGQGSKDPDDLNGDGHPDLLMTVSTRPATGASDQSGADQRIAVVFGSAHGLDPTTRVVHERGDFGLPAHDPVSGGSADSISADDIVTADLDGDGFPDYVDTVPGERATDGLTTGQRLEPYVTWGSANGPAGGRAIRIRLPAAAKLGMSGPVRGDFDGDGHLDLAGQDAGEQNTVWILYGPFDRSSGAAARTGTLPARGGLIADDVDPRHPRRTGLLVRTTDDGEQEDGVWYADVRSGHGVKVRKGNAHAFGDFDGDGKRDLAVGDDGGRNNEPGYETEAADVDGSLAVYPGDGGDPVTYRLPDPEGLRVASHGFYRAADPDGDGRDALLLTASAGGVSLAEGSDAQTVVRRQGPAEVAGKKMSAARRGAHVVEVADFDGDGKDELVWGWGLHASTDGGRDDLTHWWIAEGISTRDEVAFLSSGFAR
ncbi:hypothetical protein [Streptomyces sp. NPDC057694]|uniref:hypothetical protein n=1 Tax=Streptomyces sp. NPDC057694 TaxID=3346216 RepID=UPI00367B8AB1